jgi:alpha-beta hydrolase superfamily lysophospholipase
LKNEKEHFMKKIKVSFKGGQAYRLGARLDMPDTRNPQAYALFAHCFTCTKNLKAIHNIDESLTENGIAVLRFDFTGLGESEGDFEETNFSTNVVDLVAAARFLEEEHRPPQILIGHSMGGAAVLQAASRIKTARAVVTVAAPSDPEHIERFFMSKREEIERNGEAVFNIGGSSFRISKQFLDDLEKNSMQNFIENLNKPLLLFHSPLDDVVGIENAIRIFTAARHPKSFISLDKADHLLMKEEDSHYVGRLIAAWASRYLDKGN